MTTRPITGHVAWGAEDAPVRMVLLHYAGGSAASMLPLARNLPRTCHVVLPDLNDPADPAHTFTAAVTRLLPRIAELLDRPTVVLGHSMGALMAHAVIEALPDDRRRHVTDVVLSGSRSPATTSSIATFPPAAFTTRTRAELAADMSRYGGCPPELFTDPQLLHLAVTKLGHDMQLIDTYRTPVGRAAGAGPTGPAYHVWYGHDDTEASEAEARRWAGALPRPPHLRGFPGGHFYLLEHAQAGQALHHLTTAGNG
ncbi:alpha/beta fold hydrolase [Streptomyces sp. NPDC047315]|uniref:thioesterase II family protein n=1 Tax=Streptomyces sp. NPDC047315 TaxID=3155142 RepID=UPI0033C57218